jgi:hydroxymethylbilane synthase
LALAQCRQLLDSLASLNPGVRFEMVPIKTQGDLIASAAELRRAGKGLFVKEIERALLKKKVSLAVHSMKDLPSEQPEGLVLGAVPERADPRDVFIGRSTAEIGRLSPGSIVGTSSLRRQAILKALHPQLKFGELKGNLDTRLAKLRAPRATLAGIVVAAAGLERLYGDGRPAGEALPADQVVPAAGQGALALEIREDDEVMRRILAPAHHAATAACVEAERELQRRLEGGCQVPLGVHGTLDGDGILTLTACLAEPDGSRLIRERQSGSAEDPKSIAEALETILASRGAREILASLRRSR